MASNMASNMENEVSYDLKDAQSQNILGVMYYEIIMLVSLF